MKRTITIGFVVALLALSATQLLALDTGTWTCMGYTITVTPTDPANPGLAGIITIDKTDDYAVVDIDGTYCKESGRRPMTVVDIAGTITTPDGVMEVARQFKFPPGPQKTVWRSIIAWLDGQIAG